MSKLFSRLYAPELNIFENKKVLSVIDICGLFKDNKISINDNIIVAGKYYVNDILFQNVVTEEKVYDISEDNYFETFVNNINGNKRPDKAEIPRFRYFLEGFRSPLPFINPAEIWFNFQLLNKIIVSKDA